MANLKEIRTRIDSVSSTMQITSAMKMVSASKLKRAQGAITQMRPYAEKLQEILSNVSANLDSSEGIYSQERKLSNVLLVAITSNRGLCGAFNNNVVKEAKRLATEMGGANVKILPIGKKAADILKKSPMFYVGDYGNNTSEIWGDLTFDASAEISNRIMSEFEDGKWDKVVVIYNKFKNAAAQILMAEQFLPILPNESADSDKNIDYIFEPDRAAIVEEIIPKSLRTQLFKALLESHASEHGARMTAMHKATENADDLRHDLKLYYNKARQAAITAEILEIVGGAEALGG